MLLLLAIGDCMANNRSQAEVAKKYGIPRSRVQRVMSGKKEHKKGGKQYRQERKQRLSEEDPGSDKRAKKDQQRTEAPQVTMTPQEETGKKDKEYESSRDELPDVKL